MFHRPSAIRLQATSQHRPPLVPSRKVASLAWPWCAVPATPPPPSAPSAPATCSDGPCPPPPSSTLSWPPPCFLAALLLGHHHRRPLLCLLGSVAPFLLRFLLRSPLGPDLGLGLAGFLPFLHLCLLLSGSGLRTAASRFPRPDMVAIVGGESRKLERNGCAVADAHKPAQGRLS